MIRRTLLLSPLALAACNTPAQIDAVLATAADDANTIANGLQGMLPQLGALNLPGLTPAVVATVGSAVADIKALATSLSGVTSTAAAQPLVQKIETYLNVIVTTLAILPLPPPISTILQAASILLPIIETAIGLLIPPAPATARMRASAPTMTPDQARLTLLASVAK